MKIAFVYPPVAFGSHRPPLDFSDLHGKNGLTGTDLVATVLPVEMAKRGHDVALYCDRAVPGSYDGVTLLEYKDWAQTAQSYDAAISASNPNPLKACKSSALRAVNRQVSTFGIDCEPGWEGWTDLVMCPSRTAIEKVRVPGPRFDVLPNGCDLSSFAADDSERVPGRCVYISSPDRGLHWVMQEWSKIRKRVPHATLKVFYYSLNDWLSHHTASGKHIAGPIDAECQRRAHYIAQGLQRLKDHGVEQVGGVTHAEMARELSKAQALLYPCDTLAFTETFGVAVLEAQAAGCVPVLSDADCFGELWGESSACVSAPVGKHIADWTHLAIEVLTNAEYRETMSAAARANAAKYTWAASAEKLEALIATGKRAPVVDLVRPESLVIHGVLTEYASGNVLMYPENPYEAKTGGGCRTGFNQLMRGLAAMGHRVRAFSTWAHTGVVEGVAHLPLNEMAMHGEPDAAVHYYDTSQIPKAGGRVRIASHHTYAVPFPNSVSLADINTAPSDHAANAIRGCLGGRGWLTLPNIVPPGLPEWAPVRGRVLYHTSPDRGLHRLIQAWPEIRRRVPFATLHVVGDVEGWATRMQSERCAQGDRARWVLRDLPAAIDAGGVELLGRLTRAGVNREIAEAACVGLPFDAAGPCETWSTSIVEAMAVGIPVVLAPCDALEELWGNVAVNVGSIGDDGDVREFVRGVAMVLTASQDWADSYSKFEREAVSQFTPSNAARILDSAIREQLEGKKVAA